MQHRVGVGCQHVSYAVHVSERQRVIQIIEDLCYGVSILFLYLFPLSGRHLASGQGHTWPP